MRRGNWEGSSCVKKRLPRPTPCARRRYLVSPLRGAATSRMLMAARCPNDLNSVSCEVLRVPHDAPQSNNWESFTLVVLWRLL